MRNLFIIFIVFTLMVVFTMPAFANVGEYDNVVIIYPNGKGLFRLLGGDDNLVIGDVGVTYEVDHANNEVDIYFDEPIFIDDVVSEGNTIHKTIKFDSENEVRQVGKELSTSGFLSDNVCSINLEYDDVSKVDSITLQSTTVDFSGGLLDNIPFTITNTYDYKGQSIGETFNVTDNTNLTKHTFLGNQNGTIYISFDYPINITSFKYNNSLNGLSLQCYDEFDKTIGAMQSLGYINRNKDISFFCSDVYGIRITNGTSNKIDLFEFNIYGESLEPKPVGDIKSLESFVSNRNVLLTWMNPENINFIGVNIYRDDYLIKKNYDSRSYTDTNLELGTYIYKITTLDINGNESLGVVISVTITNVLPDNVDNFMTTIDGNNVLLTWDNPLDNFLCVDIYRDGNLIAENYKGNLYLDENLELKKYTYKIVSKNEEGLESSGIILSADLNPLPDIDPPSIPINIQVSPQATRANVRWDHVNDDDLDGYNLYLNNYKYNSKPIKNSYIEVVDLNEESNYFVQVTAIDKAGNESQKSEKIYFETLKVDMPRMPYDFDLRFVTEGVSGWFLELFPILAFSVGISVALILMYNIKKLFMF